MAINKKLNERLDITLPKSQSNWIKEQAEKIGISKSKFISWILARRIKSIIEELKVYETEDPVYRREEVDNQIDAITDEEIDELIKKATNPKK